ncbi:MAG TPA: TIGR03619 family F420-dependent LLM class oxidoreductase [Acidimicrobiales bacterium]|nr:TIGR03619 family F420-dependent LLM class oxidoreductase [Acidimicrobiales bacterium]
MTMKFGVFFANTGPYGTVADSARALGAAAEAAGFESVWTVEHVVVPKGYESTYPYDPSGRMPGPEESPIPDPLIWLSYLAAATSTLKLATGILIVPQRNPLVLAKECGTLDLLSGGRLLLGVGAGWLEEEFDALGIPFEDRGRRLDDHIGALRAAWGDQPASFKGEFTSFDDVYVQPQPVDGSVPIIVGGHSAAAARRAGRLGNGFFPGRARDEDLSSLIGTMRAAAEEAGRDPDAVEVTAVGLAVLGSDPLAAVEHYAELGISRLVIPPLSYDAAAVGDTLADFATRVIHPSA